MHAKYTFSSRKLIVIVGEQVDSSKHIVLCGKVIIENASGNL